jgi:hypothetical protein
MVVRLMERTCLVEFFTFTEHVGIVFTSGGGRGGGWTREHLMCFCGSFLPGEGSRWAIGGGGGGVDSVVGVGQELQDLLLVFFDFGVIISG